MWMTPPIKIETQLYSRMPTDLRRPVVTAWSRANKSGAPIDSFLEGPCFGDDENLYLVDIPHGRILSVDARRQWRVIAEYDGEPNGLALLPDGCLAIADYRNGILKLDTSSGTITSLLERRNAERFKGPNDLLVASNGDIFFTDQGQTGLHDPTGRVYRLSPNGRLDSLISNGPSPNGLALSQDETVLFVAMTRDNAVWRLPLLNDGSTAKVGRFASFYGTGGPDGMVIDSTGNLLVAHSSLGAVFVLAPDGELIARIASCAGCSTTNLTFTKSDPATLIITESSTGSILMAEWPTAISDTDSLAN